LCAAPSALIPPTQLSDQFEDGKTDTLATELEQEQQQDVNRKLREAEGLRNTEEFKDLQDLEL
jgi:hypothetical protein